MTAFFELLRQIPAPFNMVVMIVAIGSVCGVLTALISQIRTFADHESDRRLKRDMIEAGLSIDEVERIAAMKVTEHYEPVEK